MPSIDERRQEEREQRGRSRLRLIAASVVLILLTFIALAQVLAPFFGRPDLHVSEFIYGTLAGLFVILIGIEVPSWWRWKP